MKSFRHYIRENTTSNMAYGASKDFATDVVSTNFDVEDWGEKRGNMKPWEVRNAENATSHRNRVMAWLKAAVNREEAVNDKSLPFSPKWQSRTR